MKSTLSLLAAAIFGVVQPCGAQVVWNGSVDDFWGTDGNWGAGFSPSGGINGTLRFGAEGAGGNHLVMMADGMYPGVTQLNFTGADGGYVISGEGFFGFDAGASIVNDTLFTQTINVDLDLSFGAPVSISGDGDLVLGGDIRGLGGLKFDGLGDYTLNGNNTYSGGTTIDGGANNIPLRITFSRDTAFGAGDITVESGVVFEPVGEEGRTLANDFTFLTSADVSFTGGALTLTGDATLTDTLNLDVSNQQLTIDGVISGGGSLIKKGGQRLTLNGANTFDGDLEVRGGVLDLRGSITSDALVRDTGILEGDGTIGGDLVVVQGGTVAPGRSIGTLTVDGDFDLGSVYEIEVGAGETSDLIDVDGMARLQSGSTLSVNPVEGELIATGDTFTVVSAIDGVIDDGTNIEGTALIDYSVDTLFADGDIDYAIVADRHDIVDVLPAEIAGGPGIGEALDKIIADLLETPEGQLLLLALSLDQLGEDEFVEAITDLSPEPYDIYTTTGIRAAEEFNNVNAAYLAERRSGRMINVASLDGLTAGSLVSLSADPSLLAQAIAEQEAAADASDAAAATGASNEDPWGVFVRGFGIYNDNDSTSDRTGFDGWQTGAVAGVDFAFSEGVIGGLGFGYTKTDVSIDTDRGDLEADTYRFGPYLTWGQGDFFLDTSLSFGYSSYDAKRKVRFLDLDATGDYNGWDVSAYVGAGYEFRPAERWTLAPVGSLQYTYLDFDGFTEKGADFASITMDARNTDSLVSRLGGRTTYSFGEGDSRAMLGFGLGWRHEFQDADSFTARFAAASSDPFTVDAGSRDRDSVFFNVDLFGSFSSNVGAFIRYEGNIGSDSKVHAISTGLTFEF